LLLGDIAALEELPEFRSTAGLAVLEFVVPIFGCTWEMDGEGAAHLLFAVQVGDEQCVGAGWFGKS
jgi:hypothetical protein